MLLDKNYLKKIIISQDSKILEAINNLNISGLKIVLVVDKNKKFVGVVNDGDIRRAFSSGYNINSSIRHVVNKKSFFVKTILDINNFSPRELDEFSHIPVIKNNKIYGLYAQNINSNITEKNNKEHVVIMAGGYGKRLGVLTKKCPKALLKFNNKPLLQHILEYVKKNNFYNIQISLFFLKKMIKNFILKKNHFSLKIKFLEERSPMGTIGSIGLIKKISSNFVVLNCDVISDVNLNELLKFHKKHKSILTIGIKHFQYKNPYGVIISKKNRFISFKEKPDVNFTINTGIYVFNRKIISIIKKFNLRNIEDLITKLNNNNYKILTYPIFENWHDLGQDKKKLKKYN
jgi:dTDP-glucose pyrophosphorylase/predicted transcriptional regulator